MHLVAVHVVIIELSESTPIYAPVYSLAGSSVLSDQGFLRVEAHCNVIMFECCAR